MSNAEKSNCTPDRPLLGYCTQHPREAAHVAYEGPETGGKRVKFCRECWRAFRNR
jgi:hypothetical protein